MPTVLVYLIRHAETQENASGIIQGQLDTELNESGRGQAATVALALQSTPFAFAYSSDLKRAKHVSYITSIR
jgi:broad specificity phosphatase PhoE